ncbi:carboxypeptidase-like regulatory domain-containing protein [uncultured Algibacter sp.]|uniref:TonB-dependent receptor n=1 Tax=uncultured Algibacter sp. TaxID=298659 RepID=UPI0026106F93|nr:carboxypeptidase-like regulatory domain-containing protein [uncultured Algibacter sp.]
MKKTTHFLMVAMVLLFTISAMAQSTISGTVLETGTGLPLPGANVIEKGTTNGVTSDFDGNFTIKTQTSSGEIVITYIGYTSKTIAFTGDIALGNVVLESSQVGLEEVQIIASVAVDRKTPVAVSTIKAADISLKLSTQEFPEILKSTPGVYATRAGGGYGDGRINLRGFSSENIAVMINGVPVNDMENGRIFWSNWAGLGDVTSTMQVQRGLGASKVAVPSIGGTINIITKSTDATQGGIINTGIANDGYFKYGMTYSTGLSDKGFAATVSASKISGDGYIDGGEFSGYNYFLSLSKQLNERNRLTFTAFGAQQTHGQRFNRSTIAELLDTDSGPQKANKDWGYKNGEVYHASYNFYHKPQISLNHLWEINDNSVLSTALYTSFGSGGGRRDEGSKIGSSDYRIGSSGLQPIDFDRIVSENIANGAAGSTDIISASRNSHEWYGILSTYKNTINDKLTISGGLDARYYVGHHWYEVEDLLGGQFFLDNEDDTFAFGKPLRVGDRYNKDYDGIVLRSGIFGQAEYQVNESLNLFMAADISNTNYKKKEFMNSDIPINDRESDAINFFGFGIKGGGNYNLDINNNVFVNVGYFSKAPFLDGVAFQDDDLLDPNEEAENEKVFSVELGYGYRGEKLSANVNLYRTTWLDKGINGSLPGVNPGDERVLYNLLGMDALHQGIEIDFRYKFSDELTFTGMASIGDWKWKSNVSAIVRTQDGTPVGEVDVFAEDLKVGDAAQTTFALGANYKFATKSSFYVDYNYAGDMYASYQVTNRGTAGLPDTWKVPEFGLFDTGISHAFSMGSFEAILNAKINNVFNTEYVADANDVDGTSATALVYYGPGRTYSVGLTVNF